MDRLIIGDENFFDKISCIQHDTADGLKAGLDEALLKHSRAALMYYLKQGISTEEEEKKKE